MINSIEEVQNNERSNPTDLIQIMQNVAQSINSQIISTSESTNKKIGDIENKLKAMEQKINAMEQKINAMEQKINAIEYDIHDIKNNIVTIEEKSNNVQEKLRAFEETKDFEYSQSGTKNEINEFKMKYFVIGTCMLTVPICIGAFIIKKT